MWLFRVLEMHQSIDSKYTLWALLKDGVFWSSLLLSIYQQPCLISEHSNTRNIRVLYTVLDIVRAGVDNGARSVRMKVTLS